MMSYWPGGRIAAPYAWMLTRQASYCEHDGYIASAIHVHEECAFVVHLEDLHA